MLPTVAGRNPANQLGKDSLSHYLQRVLAPSQVVGNGISEPSTVYEQYLSLSERKYGMLA